MAVSRGTFGAVRMRPGEDLIDGLHAFREEMAAEAMAVVSCVGSLADVVLRHAGRDAGTRMEGAFEIVSLVGTVDPEGHHLHLSIADGDGRVTGGAPDAGCDRAHDRGAGCRGVGRPALLARALRGIGLP